MRVRGCAGARECGCAGVWCSVVLCGGLWWSWLGPPSGGGGSQLLPLVVDSRRLGGRANLESDKHAGKPGAFANGPSPSSSRPGSSSKPGNTADFLAASSVSARTSAPRSRKCPLSSCSVALKERPPTKSVTWPPMAGEERKHQTNEDRSRRVQHCFRYLARARGSGPNLGWTALQTL